MRKRLGVFATALVLAATGLGGTSAVASSSSSSATCGVNAKVKIKPGITQTPSQGTIASAKHSTITCEGTIKNKQVNGEGPISFSGTYGAMGGDTCDQGAGSGTFTASVPKSNGGMLTVKGKFTFTRAGAEVVLQGKVRHHGGAVNGSLAFAPDPGQDCVSTPVTSATVAGDVTIQG